MAYKFQLGAYVASGSLTQEGAVEVDALTADSMNLQSGGITNAGSIAGASSIDGTGDLTMGTITMTGFSVDADGDTALKSLAVDNSSTIGCDADADIMTLAAQSLVLANDVDFNVAKAGGLQIGGVAMTSTAAELNLLDGVSGLVKADFTKLAAVDASATELNYLDGFGTETYAFGDDSVVFFDATDSKLKSVSGGNFIAAVAGDGLGNNSGRMEVKVDDSGIEINSDTLRLKDNGVTLAKMAGITAGQFIIGDSNGDPASVALSGDATLAANGALTIANNAVSLAKLAGLASANFILGDSNGDPAAVTMSGDATLANNGAITLAAAQTNVTSIINSSMGKIGTAANQEYIDFGTANEIKFAINDSLVATVEAGKFVIAGDLQVNGTTTTIDSTTINISSSFTFEGPADAHETILTCGSPTADATLELFQGAAGTYYMPVFADSNAKTTVIAATAAEVNTVCDGDNARGTSALADGDGFIHNDNGTMKQTNVLKMFEYTVDKVSGDATIADTGVLTIAAAAVHHGMLNDDIISGQDELLHADILDADELMISDGGVIKRVGVDSIQNHAFGKVSGDATIADGGALTIAADAIESGMLNDNIISGQTELASGDAVDADEMLISDGGTLKKIGLDSLKVYMSDAAAVVANKADGDTLIVGVNYFSDMGSDGEDAVTLPASAGMSVGQSVKVKAPSDCSAARYITINKAGSQTIDGAASIRLESPFSAVELVYVAADLWRVF